MRLYDSTRFLHLCVSESVPKGTMLLYSPSAFREAAERVNRGEDPVAVHRELQAGNRVIILDIREN